MEEKELRLQGYPVSEGIAIGTSFFILGSSEESFPEFPITVHEVEGEIARYRRALFYSREDLRKLQGDLATEKLQSDFSTDGYVDAMKIIDTHIQMLDDPIMTTHMEEKIRHMRQNTESVFRSVIKDYEKRFTETKDSFFQERLIDVMDLSRRILGHLCPRERSSFNDLPPHTIVFSKELNPSETAAMQSSRVTGFVTEAGGGNSHAALIARAKGIPFVVGIDIHLLQGSLGKSVIVDGLKGEVIINPMRQTLSSYRQIKEKLIKRRDSMEKENHLNAQTTDGHLISLYANVGSLSDVEEMHRQRMQGVGLYRSEYLILEHPSLIYSEEDQYHNYRDLIKRAKGSPVVFRVFDMGGDKYPDLCLEEEKEQNSVLGCRGIRFLLRFKNLFRIQLRAILRGSIEGEAFLLLPLISEIEELRQAKKLIREVEEELKTEGAEFKASIPVGCMIELPSAVFIADLLAQESDFLSIGTNDLVQYSLGIDRSHSHINDLCFPAHPSIIRMMQQVIAQARLYKKPVSICGEIASKPLFIPLLLGLGVEEISFAPRYAPEIKRMIRRSSLKQAKEITDRILSTTSFKEVSRLLIEEYHRLMPDEEGMSISFQIPIS